MRGVGESSGMPCSTTTEWRFNRTMAFSFRCRDGKSRSFGERRGIVALATIAILATLAGVAQAGWDEGWKAYKAGDYATALREWQGAAATGNSSAQNGLGDLYANGQGV